MMLIRKFVVPLQNEALCNSQMNGWMIKFSDLGIEVIH